jgi:hypothetical protein
MKKLFLLCLLLIGCGVDGDDGSSTLYSPKYTGIKEQATITANNNVDLTIGSLQGIDISFFFEFNIKINNLKVKEQETRTEAIIKKNGVIPGECSGNIEYKLIIDEKTGNFTGDFIFNDYCEAKTIVDGSVPIDGIFILDKNEFEILNINLTNLSFKNFVILNGDISIDYKGAPIETLILSNFLIKEKDKTEIHWIKEYLLNITDNDILFEINSVSGKYYNPIYGYIEVFVLDNVVYSINEEWPKEGIILNKGAAGASTILEVIDDISYIIKADRNGDNIYEIISEPFLWGDL